MKLLRPSLVVALLVAAQVAQAAWPGQGTVPDPSPFSEWSASFQKAFPGSNKMHCADTDGSFKGLVADQAFDRRCRVYMPFGKDPTLPDDECWTMVDGRVGQLPSQLPTTTTPLTAGLSS